MNWIEGHGVKVDENSSGTFESTILYILDEHREGMSTGYEIL